MAQTSKSKSSRLLKNSLRVEHARNLECGDLSPLLLETANAGNLASKPFESGDKSPHSKKDGSLELVFQHPARRKAADDVLR